MVLVKANRNNAVYGSVHRRSIHDGDVATEHSAAAAAFTARVAAASLHLRGAE
jgi:hypothetical protein